MEAKLVDRLMQRRSWILFDKEQTGLGMISIGHEVNFSLRLMVKDTTTFLYGFQYPCSGNRFILWSFHFRCAIFPSRFRILTGFCVFSHVYMDHNGYVLIRKMQFLSLFIIQY